MVQFNIFKFYFFYFFFIPSFGAHMYVCVCVCVCVFVCEVLNYLRKSPGSALKHIYIRSKKLSVNYHSLYKVTDEEPNSKALRKRHSPHCG